MQNIFVLYIYAMVPLAACYMDEQPYCAPRYRTLCQGKGNHVSCQFPEPGPGGFCENYSLIKMEDHLKHYIVHYINRRRQRLASGSERVRGGEPLPKPEIMMMVEWDRELALLAQRLADQCSFIHDECRATVRYPYAGQTVGEVRMRRSSDSDAMTAQRAIRRVFDAWWGERRRVQPYQLTSPFRITTRGAIWGHFSQLAVWSLRAVGCGAVRHGASYPRLLLVCDFSHTNMLGQRTITPGPLAPCPIHTARRTRSPYPLLCGPVRSTNRHSLIDIEAEESFSEDVGTDLPNSPSDVPTPKRGKERRITIKHDKFVPKTTIHRYTETESEEANAEYSTSVPPRLKTSKRTFVEKLDQELEIEKRKYNKNQNNGIRNSVSDDRVWRSRVVTLIALGYEHDQKADEESRNVPKERKFKQQLMEVIPDDEVDLRGPLNFVSELPSESVRQKWRPLRYRPKRPGASALLKQPSSKMITRHRPGVSLMMDKEDIDQLFRDTGFSPTWIKRPLSL